VTTLSSDPNVVSAVLAEALKEEPIKVTTEAPSNNEVILPGGYISPGGILAKYAEVKELNGSDEEAISRAGSLGKSLTTILQRGVISIGGEPLTKDTLDDLLAADRDALLLAIRRVTFGESVEYRAQCQNCGVEQVVDIHLENDISMQSLDNPITDRQWSVETKAGTVILALPTGSTQKRLVEATDKTTAELGTILLAGCVLTINDKVSVGASSVLKLGMGDREKLIEEIIAHNPGPRLGEVTKTCEACGESMETPLSLVALFRL
jgi:hypothetical protein